MSSTSETTIRQLTWNDLVFAAFLGEMVGWNQLRADWERLMVTEPDGCFLIECQGSPAGTATTTTYGTDLGWIGMVLVHPDFRRRGLATALLNRCMKYLLDEKKVQCVKLDATPEGRKVYAKLGFQEEFELARWSGHCIPGNPVGDGEGNWNTYAALDREAFGSDRRTYLEELSKNSCDGFFGQRGYGLLREGRIARYLGPVVAESSGPGRTIVLNLLRASESHPVFWDIPEENQAAVSLAEELGFERKRRLVRMWMGKKNAAGRSDLQWAIGAPETG